MISPVLSIPQWLVGILRDRLSSGELRPGDWIKEKALALEFDVSNGPVREALQTLVAEGLLERVHNRGVRVIALDDRAIVELFQLRASLLQLAAELAAMHCDAKARTAGAAVLKRLGEHERNSSRPFDGYLMHWIFETAGNRFLEPAWSQLVARSRIYVNESKRRTADPKPYFALGRALVMAIMDGAVSRSRERARELSALALNERGLTLFP